jgi:cell division septation protein DedD
VAHSDASDDGFHEIQLNGKQLVFLFMAATVVSVVIFLCGVLVGRGVRATRGAVAQAAALDEVPAPDVASAPGPAPAPAASVSSGSDPTVAAPPPALDDLSYANRLEKTVVPNDDLKPAPRPDPVSPAKAEATAIPAARPVPVPKAEAARPAPEPQAASPSTQDPPASAPTGAAANAAPASGFTVQVAAVNARAEADSIVRRLTAKGYAAYIEVPQGGSSPVFRVRIGTFKTRREADVVAAKLQAEQQIKPWVTR